MQDFHEAALSARVARSQVLLPPTPRPKPRCAEKLTAPRSRAVVKTVPQARPSHGVAWH